MRQQSGVKGTIDRKKDAARNVIDNAGSDPNGDLRRSGGSPNDPDGGHELMGGEWRGPDPDPIRELVPGGQGAESPPYSRDELEAGIQDHQEEAIRLRAYHLWEQAGRPAGDHDHHWHQAEAELALRRPRGGKRRP